jgi:hypothetical protein
MTAAWSARAKVIILCSLALGFAVPLGAQTSADCRSAKLLALDEAEATLAERSMQIMRLAQKSDLKRLESLVSPSAEFTVWSEDNGIDGDKGPAGAIEFTKQVGATAYAYATVFPGPVSTDVCAKQKVTVWLSGEQATPAYIVTFEFQKGRLTGGRGEFGLYRKR